MLVNLGEDEWDAVIRVHLKGHFAPMRHATEYWRGESKAGPPAGRARDQHVVRRRADGQHRAGQLLGGQGRHRRADARRRGRVGALRRDRQRDRAGGPHPDDRGGVRRHDGGAGRRLRRDGAGERLAAGRLARQRRVGARHRSGVRGRGRHRSRSPTAGSTARPATRARAGSRPSSAPVVDELLAEAPAPAPVYGA